MIVHGYGGSGATHWQRWLERKCRHLGIETHFPNLPDRFAEPKLPAWLEALERTMPVISQSTALVGHSMACPAILQLLARQSNEAGLVVLAAPVTRDEMFPCTRHFWDGFDPASVRGKTRRIEMFTSDNDRYVDTGIAQRLAADLGAGFHIIPGAGHLSVAAGYHAFPEVLELIAPSR